MTKDEKTGAVTLTQEDIKRALESASDSLDELRKKKRKRITRIPKQIRHKASN